MQRCDSDMIGVLGSYPVRGVGGRGGVLNVRWRGNIGVGGGGWGGVLLFW